MTALPTDTLAKIDAVLCAAADKMLVMCRDERMPGSVVSLAFLQFAQGVSLLVGQEMVQDAAPQETG